MKHPLCGNLVLFKLEASLSTVESESEKGEIRQALCLTYSSYVHLPECHYKLLFTYFSYLLPASSHHSHLLACGTLTPHCRPLHPTPDSMITDIFFLLPEIVFLSHVLFFLISHKSLSVLIQNYFSGVGMCGEETVKVNDVLS